MADRYFTYEIQHVFPAQILTENSDEARAARRLLAKLGSRLIHSQKATAAASATADR